jgi:HSP20 family protein
MSLGRNVIWGTSGAIPSDVRHVFDRFFQPEEGHAAHVVTHPWAPRVDIKEEDQRFVIFVDVPGVDPASIDINMEKGVLSIKGERAVEKSEQSSRFTRVERAHGSFHRRFTLPDSADAENITASGKHGVLEIMIPKKAETAPRRITVNTAQ